MKSLPQSAATVAIALLCLAGAAVNGLGFVACDLELTKLVRGLGFLSPLLLAAPTGMGLLVVGLLEAVAAAGLFVGAVLLMCRRRAGVWFSLVASVSGLLAGLLLVTHIVSAPLVFGKEMAGLPTDAVSWSVFAYALLTTISTVALSLSAPKPYQA
ncbi:hypothetical protein [Mycobacterium stomatepiae]|uniref:Integral membrane protein n=1 Tax=Mycobacterium stomatepiae TaxID=470076 RepID=A0A7I7QBI9_9MYCO|nr:hypothetical protein [Mycobacterium stomatepiae]MCV7164124.1 hypothetical protein [Mycobacterium stomatepiae]BBY23397.1 hypothetical protein MSTO_36020 [Mycobacterium stomatepiae]